MVLASRQSREVFADCGGRGILRPEPLLADRQRPLIEWPRARRGRPATAAGPREISEAHHDLEALGPERLRLDRQRRSWSVVPARSLWTCSMKASLLRSVAVEACSGPEPILLVRQPGAHGSGRSRPGRPSLAAAPRVCRGWRRCSDARARAPYRRSRVRAHRAAALRRNRPGPAAGSRDC